MLLNRHENTKHTHTHRIKPIQKQTCRKIFIFHYSIYTYASRYGIALLVRSSSRHCKWKLLCICAYANSAAAAAVCVPHVCVCKTAVECVCDDGTIDHDTRITSAATCEGTKPHVFLSDSAVSCYPRTSASLCGYGALHVQHLVDRVRAASMSSSRLVFVAARQWRVWSNIPLAHMCVVLADDANILITTHEQQIYRTIGFSTAGRK